jgi:hypothetical protein
MKISVITVFNVDQTILNVLKKIEVKDTFNATYYII